MRRIAAGFCAAEDEQESTGRRSSARALLPSRSPLHPQDRSLRACEASDLMDKWLGVGHGVARPPIHRPDDGDDQPRVLTLSDEGQSLPQSNSATMDVAVR